MEERFHTVMVRPGSKMHILILKNGHLKTECFKRLQYVPIHALFLHGFVSRNDPSQSCWSDDFTHSRARIATPSPQEIEQALQGDHFSHDAARK